MQALPENKAKNYRIIKFIGGGAFGEVFLVEHIKTG